MWEFLQELLGATGVSDVALGTIITLIVAKVLPNEALEKFFEGIGEIVSGFGNRWKWWQKVEDLLIEGLAVSVTALIKGLRKDNSG